MEQEIITKAKEMLTNADTGTNDCKHYNNGFMDGVEYTIKALRQPPVSGSFCKCKKLNYSYTVPVCNKCNSVVDFSAK